jgi:hypothetical protein
MYCTVGNLELLSAARMTLTVVSDGVCSWSVTLAEVS